jgi:hypothetical protein
MANRYQHVLDSIRNGVADQPGELLWSGGDGAQSGTERAARSLDDQL